MKSSNEQGIWMRKLFCLQSHESILASYLLIYFIKCSYTSFKFSIPKKVRYGILFFYPYLYLTRQKWFLTNTKNDSKRKLLKHQARKVWVTKRCFFTWKLERADYSTIFKIEMNPVNFEFPHNLTLHILLNGLWISLK